MKALWLADVLRAAGLQVVEQPGWKQRGRGDFTAIRGVVCHHTAGPLKGNAPSLGIVTKGREGLPGPLSQLVLGRDGTYFVVASGKSNHAGPGKWQGVIAGNSQMIGIEAENTGLLNDQPWPPVQMDAYIRGVAAILNQIKADAVMACGHKEYAQPKGRKSDPTFDMVAFRAAVEQAMTGKAIPETPNAVDPARSMLRKGDMGPSVKKLQQLLGIKADGNFGPKTEAKVKAFQKSKRLVADGLVGQKTWAALGITNSK